MSETQHKVVYSLQTEMALLSSMMLQPSAAHNTMAFGITGEDFFDIRNQALFLLFQDRLAQGKSLDYVVCWDEVERQKLFDYGYYIEVFSFCVCGSNWKEYCQILREYTIARRALKAGATMSEAASDPGLVRNIESISRELVDSLGAMQLKNPVRFADQVDEAFDSLDSEIPVDRFGFGLLDLDTALGGGALKGNLVVIAGDTGRGKSILLGMAALEAAMKGYGVCYYTIEMTAKEMILRLGASLARRQMVSKLQLQTANDRQAALESRQILKETRISMRSDLIEIDQIVVDAQKEILKGNCDVVIVDYIQICQCQEGDNRSQHVAAISRKLQNLTKSGCVVFAASQINKEGEAFESRAIRNDANILIAIEQYKDKPRLLIAKNRTGRMGITIPVTLNGDISRFE